MINLLEDIAAYGRVWISGCETTSSRIDFIPQERSSIIGKSGKEAAQICVRDLDFFRNLYVR